MNNVRVKQQEIVAKRRERVIKFLEDQPNGRLTEDLIMGFISRDDNYPFMDLMAMVRQFHTVNDIPLEEMPQCIEAKFGAIRFNLMYEEAKETQDATRVGDIIEIYDGLGDQMYILLGTIMRYGMHDVFLAGFKAVHDSNMTKLGVDGKPIYRTTDGKVLKGPFYKPPTDELKKLLAEHFQKVNNDRQDNN